jgi:glycosyltransferase involved in cell wall biosynthesis
MGKKVLLIIGSAAIGGAEKQIVNLALKLNKNHECAKILFLTEGGSLETFLQNNKIEYEIANFKNNANIINFCKSIKLIIKHINQGYNIFYIFLPQAILFFGSLSRFWRRKIVLIYGVRGSIYLKNNLLYKLYRRELRNSDLIICNSQFLKNELLSQKKIDTSKIEIIRNGIDLNINVANRLKRPVGTHRVLVVSNFKSYKGHDLLLEAVKQVNNTQLLITFVGDGEQLAKIKADSKRIKNHSFYFAGQSTQFQELYGKNDFVLHPSRTESLSNAILESLCFGLPVICFNIGGNDELIDNSSNGYLINPFDTKQFASAISILTSDDVHLGQLSKNAFMKSKQFSWEHNLELHLKAFSRAMVVKDTRK